MGITIFQSTQSVYYTQLAGVPCQPLAKEIQEWLAGHVNFEAKKGDPSFNLVTVDFEFDKTTLETFVTFIITSQFSMEQLCYLQNNMRQVYKFFKMSDQVFIDLLKKVCITLLNKYVTGNVQLNIDDVYLSGWI